MLILNKVDLVETAQSRADPRVAGRSLPPLPAGAGQADRDVPNDVLSMDRPDPERVEIDADSRRHRHIHATAFSSWSYETEQPLSLEALRNAASRLPASVYRAKGVVHRADEPERRAVLQVVGQRVDVEAAEEGSSAPGIPGSSR